MENATIYLMIAATALMGVALVSAAMLRGWRDWLAFKRIEIERHRADHDAAAGTVSSASRIEMADLKERIRKLEAIAAGVEL